jgi:hypothetical protein
MTVSDLTVRNFELHVDSLLPAEIRESSESLHSLSHMIAERRGVMKWMRDG